MGDEEELEEDYEKRRTESENKRRKGEGMDKRSVKSKKILWNRNL